jgi:hypothetical protein
MTPQQYEVLQNVIEQAVADSEDYQTYGNPHMDYGDEWPETARAKAERWRSSRIGSRAPAAGQG